MVSKFQSAMERELEQYNIRDVAPIVDVIMKLTHDTDAAQRLYAEIVRHFQAGESWDDIRFELLLNLFLELQTRIAWAGQDIKPRL
jgi:hypothetical protein